MCLQLQALVEMFKCSSSAQTYPAENMLPAWAEVFTVLQGFAGLVVTWKTTQGEQMCIVCLGFVCGDFVCWRFLFVCFQGCGFWFVLFIFFPVQLCINFTVHSVDEIIRNHYCYWVLSFQCTLNKPGFLSILLLYLVTPKVP